MTYWQGMYSPSSILADATYVFNGALRQRAGLVFGGVFNCDGVVLNKGLVMSEGTLLVSGVVFADGVTIASGIVMMDGLAYPDAWIKAESTVRGDNPSAMQPTPTPGIAQLEPSEPLRMAR